jgi:hypothetical protein
MTSPPRPASQVQDLVSRRLQERRPHSRRPALSGKRTTFTAPAATIRELRSLALQHDCLMNDLVQLALADFLTAAGRPSHLAIDDSLRQAVKTADT